MLLPATTGSGESDFVIDRSARGETVVPWVEVLLPGTGSDVLEVTDAVFDMPDSFATFGVTWMVTVADPDAASPPRLHVTVPAA